MDTYEKMAQKFLSGCSRSNTGHLSVSESQLAALLRRVAEQARQEEREEAPLPTTITKFLQHLGWRVTGGRFEKIEEAGNGDYRAIFRFSGKFAGSSTKRRAIREQGK